MNQIHPLYDCTKSFEYNLEHGPFLQGIIPQRTVPPKSAWCKVFDYEVMSPVGLAACPLGAHARGISLASQLGFDVITHKTIRSHYSAPHAWPNVVPFQPFAGSLRYNPIISNEMPDHSGRTDNNGSEIKLKNENYEFPVRVPRRARDARRRDCEALLSLIEGCFSELSKKNVSNHKSFMQSLAAANSIGNASMDLEWHCQEIEKSRSFLQSGQILIVSIFGTQIQGRSVEQDFAYIAASAIESGAQVIELNFSCPNANHGILYHDVELSQRIVKEVVRVAGHIPVTVKVGTSNVRSDCLSRRIEGLRNELHNFMHAIAHAGARGIAGINTIPARVIDEHGNPYFGPTRQMSGISGAPILPYAKRWIESVAEINAQENLGLTIFGMGGITLPEQFDIFLNSGADVAMSATGALWDPYLAHKYHEKNNEIRIQSNNARRNHHPTS